MSVGVRFAVRRAGDAELGSLAMSSFAFAVTAVIGLASTRELHLADIWPFLIAGTLAPGLSQVFFVRAVREAGGGPAAAPGGKAPGRGGGGVARGVGVEGGAPRRGGWGPAFVPPGGRGRAPLLTRPAAGAAPASRT